MGASHPSGHPDAIAALVAMLFFFGCICIGCLFAMLIVWLRRGPRVLQPTPRFTVRS